MTQDTIRRIARATLALLVVTFAGLASADPPTRVMRLSYVGGAVSFAPAGSDEWVVARLNRPLVQGDRLWADRDGRGELALGNALIWVGGDTALNVLNLDERVTQVEVSQGDVTLRVRRLAPGETVEVDTPNLAFVVTRPGRYRVSVDDQGGSTFVAVRDGAAEVYGDRASYVIARGQAYRFYGNDIRDSELFALAPPDALERFAQDRERRFERTVSARYVSPDVIGYEDLDRYGAWTPVSEYGNVWFPRETPRDWAPYRNGHWSWIDPWGWTWVDDAPWGFAPFHYGRWVHVDRGWGWVPGPVNVRAVFHFANHSVPPASVGYSFLIPNVSSVAPVPPASALGVPASVAPVLPSMSATPASFLRALSSSMAASMPGSTTGPE